MTAHDTACAPNGTSHSPPPREPRSDTPGIATSVVQKPTPAPAPALPLTADASASSGSCATTETERPGTVSDAPAPASHTSPAEPPAPPHDTPRPRQTPTDDTATTTSLLPSATAQLAQDGPSNGNAQRNPLTENGGSQPPPLPPAARDAGGAQNFPPRSAARGVAPHLQSGSPAGPPPAPAAAAPYKRQRDSQQEEHPTEDAEPSLKRRRASETDADVEADSAADSLHPDRNPASDSEIQDHYSDDDDDDDDEEEEEEDDAYGGGPAPSYTAGPLDLETGQRAAFPLPTLDASLLRSMRAGAAPVSALEYLARVRHEAAARPTFMHTLRGAAPEPWAPRAQPDPPGSVGKAAAKQSLRPYALPAQVAAPPPQNPCVVVPDPALRLSTPTGVQHPAHTLAASYAAADTLQLERAWYDAFLSSFLASRRRLAETLAALPEPDSAPQGFGEWKKLLVHTSTTAPTAALLRGLDVPTARELLAYVRRCACSRVPRPMARWTFALLLWFPDTVDARDAALLRDLAKKCLHVRNKMQEKREEAVRVSRVVVESRLCLDATVAVVAGLYGQKDLVSLL